MQPDSVPDKKSCTICTILNRMVRGKDGPCRLPRPVDNAGTGDVTPDCSIVKQYTSQRIRVALPAPPSSLSAHKDPLGKLVPPRKSVRQHSGLPSLLHQSVPVLGVRDCNQSQSALVHGKVPQARYSPFGSHMIH